jgi:hypothetical protein
MKRIALVAALLGAFIFAFAGVATAGTGPNYGNSGTPNVNSNGTAITHYTASYSDPLYGPVNCIGVHQVKAKQPIQDSFTCTSTSGSPLLNSSPGAAVSAPWGWYSDFDGVYTTNLSGTVSADGMSYSAVATYSS